MRFKISPELAVTAAFAVVIVIGAVLFTRSGLGASNLPHYQSYAEAILNRRLWIATAADHSTCPWDLSFVDGKCFPYWGILPAIIHAALLNSVSDRVLTIVFSTIAVYFMLRTCQRLASLGIKGEMPRANSWPLYICIAFLTGLPATAIASRIYEEAITASLAFGFAGIFLAIKILFKPHDHINSFWNCAFGPGLLALAGLCRAPWFGVAALVSVYTGIVMRKKFIAQSPRRNAQLGFALFGPLALVGCAQLMMNQYRFGSPLDFGLNHTHFIKSYIDSGWPPFSMKYIFSNMMEYLFVALPPMDNPLTAPWDVAALHFTRLNRYFMEGKLFHEMPIALLPVMPSLCLVIMSIRTRVSCLGPCTLLAIFMMPVSLAVATVGGAIYRYQLDAIVPALIFLMPVLVQLNQQEPRFVKFHWWSILLFGIPLTVVHSIWVIRTVCIAWGWC
jgi:hypothetical protein